MLLGCEVLTKKVLQRRALASFHTLSLQLYYINALRNCKENVRQSLWERKEEFKVNF